MGSTRQPDYSVILAILLIGIAALIGINQYQYAMWNQFIALPWLYDLINPELYPHDPLVEQRINSPSFYNSGLSVLSNLFGGDIALTHFVVYIAVLLFTLSSFYQLSWQIFKDRKAGLFGLVMLIFSFPVIGSVDLWDSVLMERTVTLPILLFSVVFILRKKWLWAVVLQAIAFNLHPLSSLYLITCSWLGVIFWLGTRDRYPFYWLVLAVLVIPVLYLRHLHPSDSSSVAVSDLWMKLMYLRNAHHVFPSEFSMMEIIHAILIAIVYAGILLLSDLTADLKRFLFGFGFAVMMFLITGTIFTEVIPVRIIIQLQFFRSFVLLVILTILLWSGLVIRKPQPWLLILGVAIAAQYFYGVTVKSAAFLATAVLSFLILRRDFKSAWVQPISIAFIILAVGLVAYWQRGGLDFRHGDQDPDWYALQDWSRQNTAEDAIFIEPPSQMGFRVESLRSSYGTWHDGTKVFFSEGYGEIWWSRMTSLGCTNPDQLAADYRKNTADDFREIWANLRTQYSEGYVICFPDMPLSELDLVYQNDDFLVYRL